MTTDVQPTPSQTSAGTPDRPRRSRRSRRLRRLVRWFVLLGLAGLSSLLLLLLFLTRVGLPQMVKTEVVRYLHGQGWSLQFSQLLLGWNRGLVVENLSLHRTNQFSGPQLYAPRAQVRFDLDALKRFRIDVNSVVVKDARIFHTLTATNQRPRIVHLENVDLELNIRPNDEWEFHHFDAILFGADLHFSGILTNGSALRTWRLPKPKRKPGRPPSEWFYRLVSHAEQFRQTKGSSLSLNISGDALDLQSFGGLVELRFPTVASPWLTATNLRFLADLPPAHLTNQLAHCSISADGASTPQGSVSTVELTAMTDLNIDRPLPTSIALTGRLHRLDTAPLQADAALVDARFNPAPSWRLWPTNARITLNLTNAHTPFVKILQSSLTADLTPNPATNVLRDANISLDAQGITSEWGSAARSQIRLSATLPVIPQFRALLTNVVWESFPIPVNLAVTATGIQTPKLDIDELVTTGQWDSPRLTLQHTSQLCDGRLAAELALDTDTRHLAFNGNSTVDAQQLSPLLNTNGQRWLKKYQWTTPPRLSASGELTLPAWTNRHPDWRREVLPSITVAGRFDLDEGAYRGATFTAASSPFHLTNMTWVLPQLTVLRPEGRIDATYASDQFTRDFHWTFNSTVDVRVAEPMLEPKATKGFDYFDFSSPPRIQGQVWGRWKDPDRLGADVQVFATNFSFRGQTATEALSRVLYTNRFLTLIEPEVRREGEFGRADRVTANFNTGFLTLTNAAGNLNPYAVAAAIGPKSARTIEPYLFDSSPNMVVNGIVDIKKGRHDHDLHFEVDGGPFHWRHTHLDQISGEIHWKDRTLTMTNLEGRFKDGRIAGGARFAFLADHGAQFSFHAGVSNSELSSFIRNVFEKTNKLEGQFAGSLTITNALTTDTNSWNGYGNVQLSDGLIWDIPVFGIFSPILNTVLPGLGNSRARRGNATFSVSNSVFYSDDLEIHASGMRMQYEGAVGIDYTINSRMQVELLRNLPGLGLVISRILWPVSKLFEFEITGTLADPKARPVYFLPKILLLPLQTLQFTTPRPVPKDNPPQ